MREALSKRRGTVSWREDRALFLEILLRRRKSNKMVRPWDLSWSRVLHPRFFFACFARFALLSGSVLLKQRRQLLLLRRTLESLVDNLGDSRLLLLLLQQLRLLPLVNLLSKSSPRKNTRALNDRC